MDRKCISITFFLFNKPTTKLKQNYFPICSFSDVMICCFSLFLCPKTHLWLLDKTRNRVTF